MARETFKRGQQVEARYRGGNRFYKGVISCANRNGTYDVRYDDGDFEQDVKCSYIKRVGESDIESINSFVSQKFGRKKFKKGNKIEARYNGGKKFYSGTIAEVKKNNCYKINYDDGDVESNVSQSMIRLRNNTELSGRKKSFSKYSVDSDNSSIFTVGQEVEAKWGGKSKYYKGTIRKRNVDGTYVILYDDGDKETNVKKSLIRKKQPEKRLERGSSNLDSRSKSFSKPNTENNVEDAHALFERIHEASVKEKDLRKSFEEFDYSAEGFLSSFSFGKALKKFGVELKFSETKIVIRVFKSSINKARINYELFLKEFSKFCSGRNSSARHSKNDWVSTHEHLYSKFCAIIEDLNTDGLGLKVVRRTSKLSEEKLGKGRISLREFIIFLGDNLNVPWSRVETRKLVQCFGNNRIEASQFFLCLTHYLTTKKNEKTMQQPFQEGDIVRARFKGNHKFYKGRIVKVNRDGTYDIDYDDGDSEHDVDSSLIKLLGSARKSPRSSARRTSPTFHIDEKVQARFGGGRKYFSGSITRVHGDGFYDINYEDGDYEKRVEEKLIRRSKDHQSVISDSNSPAVKKGSKVLSPYKNSKKKYSGRVQRIFEDNTVSVKFDDGDIDSNVDVDLIEIVESGSSRSTGLQIGDRVDAKFKKGKKFFPGVIKNIFGDRYGVEFDDGDYDGRVTRENIRVKDSTGRTKKSVSIEVSDEESFMEYEIGNRVEARLRKDQPYIRGKIKRVHGKHGCDILFDIGKYEKRVPNKHIRLLKKDTGRKSARFKSENNQCSFKIGDAVEAREHKNATFRQGTIVKVHGVSYCDVEVKSSGQVLHRVKIENIKPIIPNISVSSDSFEKNFKVGQKVSSPKNKSEEKYIGIVKKIISPKRQVNIEFEDGYREKGINWEKISALSSNDNSLKSSSFSSVPEKQRQTVVKYEVGQLVEAKDDLGRYIPATVKSINKDNTYKVLFCIGKRSSIIKDDAIRQRIKSFSVWDRILYFDSKKVVGYGLILGGDKQRGYNIVTDTYDNKKLVDPKYLVQASHNNQFKVSSRIICVHGSAGNILVNKGVIKKINRSKKNADVLLNKQENLRDVSFSKLLIMKHSSRPDSIDVELSVEGVSTIKGEESSDADTECDFQVGEIVFYKGASGNMRRVAIKRIYEDKSCEIKEHKKKTTTRVKFEELKRCPQKSICNKLSEISSSASDSSSSANSSFLGGFKTSDTSGEDITGSQSVNLKKRIIPYLKILKKYFVAKDMKKRGLLREDSFFEALRFTGISLSKTDKVLLRSMFIDNNNQIDYKKFLGDIKLSTSQIVAIKQDEAFFAGSLTDNEDEIGNKEFTKYIELVQNNNKLNSFSLQARPVVSCLKKRKVSPNSIFRKLDINQSMEFGLAVFPTALKRLGFSLNRAEVYDLWKSLKRVENMIVGKGIRYKKFTKLLIFLHDNLNRKLVSMPQDEELPGVLDNKTDNLMVFRNKGGDVGDSSELLNSPEIVRHYDELRKILTTALDEELASDYKEIFDMFDINKFGFISKEDFCLGLSKLKMALEEKKANTLYRYIVIKHKSISNKLDIDTFRQFILKKSKVKNTANLSISIQNVKFRLKSRYTKRELLECFVLYDSNNLGYITLTSLKKVFYKLKLKIDIERMFLEFAYSNREKFDYQAFVNFVFSNDANISNIHKFLRKVLKDSNNDSDAVFKFFSGKANSIPPKTFVRMLVKAGVKATESDALEVFRNVDIDNDNVLGVTEFRLFLSKLETSRVTEENRLSSFKAIEQDEEIPDEHKLPTKPSNIEHYIREKASKEEKENFYKFIKTVKAFEKNIFSKKVKKVSNGEIILPLGEKLQVRLRFLLK